MVNRQSIVRATDNQVSAELSGAVVVLHMKDGLYYQLNEVGAQVWKKISEAPRHVGDLVRAIVDEYDVEEARCEADIVALIEDMLRRGLVEIAEQR
jgi:hypothetical protein